MKKIRCQSVGWLLAFGEFGLNKRSLSEVSKCGNKTNKCTTKNTIKAGGSTATKMWSG